MVTTYELILFIISCFVLLGANLFGVVRLQQAYTKKDTQAANLRIDQMIPTQIELLIYFYFIYFESTPTAYSLPFALIGTFLILVSGFLLGKREFRLQEIK